MENQTQIRKQMIITIIGMIQFILVSLICMFLYSGGTYMDNSSEGYDFFNNVFSDLGRLVALNGDSNLFSCIIYNSSLIFLGITAIFFCIGMYQILETPGKKNAIEKLGYALGIISAVSFIGVGLTPYDILGTAHGISLRLGFISAIAMFLLLALSILKTKHMPLVYAIIYFICIIAQIIYTLVIFDAFAISETTEVVIQKIVVYMMFCTFILQANGGYKVLKMEEYMRS